MHVGNYLKDVIKKERFNMTQIAELVNKSPAGVKKDLAKEKLSMAVLESYAEALSINIYQLLAKEWGIEHGKGDLEVVGHNHVHDHAQETYAKKTVRKMEDDLSVTLTLKGKKKERILKILFEE